MFHRTSTESANKVDPDGGVYRSNTDEQRIAIKSSRSSHGLKGSVVDDTIDAVATTTAPIGSNNSTDIPTDRYWPLSSKFRGQSSASGTKQQLHNNHQQATTSNAATTTPLSHLNSPHIGTAGYTTTTTREDTTKSHSNSLNQRNRTQLASSSQIQPDGSGNLINQGADIPEAAQHVARLSDHRFSQQHSTTPVNYRPTPSHSKNSQYHQNLNHHNFTVSLAAQMSPSAATTTMPNISDNIPTTSTTTNFPPQITPSSASRLNPNNNEASSTANNPKNNQPQTNQQHARHKTYTITPQTIDSDKSKVAGKQSSSSNISPLNTSRQSESVAEQEDQLDTDEAVAIFKQELAKIGSADGLDDTDLEALGSLERSLPIELSFLIKQQAYCMARINYLTRQVKELKETRPNHGSHLNQQAQQHQHQSSSHKQQQSIVANCAAASTGVSAATNNAYHQFAQPQHHHHHLYHQPANHLDRTYSHSNRIGQHATPQQLQQQMHVKNGNLILSDDSGGEYSRATISDDDELSSLLDQIAKTVRSERNPSNQSAIMNATTGGCPSNIGVMSSPATMQPMTAMPHGSATAIGASFSNVLNPQQYTIINPGQFHQQAVPIFVMGSPLAMAHPSNINSNVLPGVHFQPEPRYNQYYEDLYAPMHRSSLATIRPSSHQSHLANQQQQHHHQFDSSISAIEQLVSQREKRQIKTQLKSADNWLKMRSGNLCNSNEIQSSNIQSGLIASSNDGGEHLEDASTDRAQQHVSAAASSSTMTPINKDGNGGNR